METLVSDLQPENAEYPIEVTLSGIVILVRLRHSENAERPIFVVPPGIMATPSLISNCAIGL
jgi:hypothetical protein